MKPEPRWLNKAAVLAVHEQLLAAHGGESGILNENGLDAALDRPRNAYLYEEKGVVELAGVYADAIARGHNFVDGNKRTALTAAVMFLEDNGVRYRGSQAEEVVQTERLASGQSTREEFCAWLGRNCDLVPTPDVEVKLPGREYEKEQKEERRLEEEKRLRERMRNVRRRRDQDLDP